MQNSLFYLIALSAILLASPGFVCARVILDCDKEVGECLPQCERNRQLIPKCPEGLKCCLPPLEN